MTSRLRQMQQHEDGECSAALKKADVE